MIVYRFHIGQMIITHTLTMLEDVGAKMSTLSWIHMVASRWTHYIYVGLSTKAKCMHGLEMSTLALFG